MSSKRSKQGEKKKATYPNDKRSGHSKVLTPTTELRELGRLRVGHVMELFALSHSSLYKRMQSGALPKPDGYDGKRPFWRVSTVRALLEKPE